MKVTAKKWRKYGIVKSFAPFAPFATHLCSKKVKNKILEELYVNPQMELHFITTK